MIITRPEDKDISILKNLWFEAFGDTSEFIDMFFRTSFNKKRATVLKINDKIASALYWFDCTFGNEKVAYIYAVATFKEFQKQGLCSKMMEETHRYLKESGYLGACLVPSSAKLFDFYAKLGYKKCIYHNENNVLPQKGNIIFKKISAEEYINLRKQYIPNNCILQKDIEFLKLQTEFFVGEDFLFSARKEKDTLIVLEFWGNKNKRPDIVYAQKAKKGVFRGLGDDMPFAMYLPFKESEMPVYLDFAYD